MTSKSRIFIANENGDLEESKTEESKKDSGPSVSEVIENKKVSIWNRDRWKLKVNRKWRDAMHQVTTAVSHGADALFTLRSLRQNPKMSDYIAAGLKLGGTMMNFIEFEEPDPRDPLSDYLDALEAEYYNLSDESFCGSTIMEIVRDNYSNKIKTIYTEESQESSENGKYYIYSADIDGVDIFWAESPQIEIDGPWVKAEEIDRIYISVGDLIWDKIGSNHCQAMEDNDGGYKFVNDTLAEKTLPSEIAKETVVKIKRYLDHPEVGPTITRSLLFYGKPGSGKSTCVRAIAQDLKMRSLRLSFFAIDSDISTTLIPSLKILQPQVVIIDDVDRTGDQELLLEQLETFRQHVRVILATCNNPSQMDSAILRPGRFDEAIQLEKLDADVIALMIGEDVPHEYREKLGEMPIAYLNEFSLCRKVLGDKEAFARVEELHGRIEMGYNAGSDRGPRRR